MEQPLAVVQAGDWHGGKEHLCGRPWDDGKLSRSLQCGLATVKAKSILSSVNSSIASRLREVIVPLYSALIGQHGDHVALLWAIQHKKHICRSSSLAEGSQAGHAGVFSLGEEAQESELVRPGERLNSLLPVPTRRLLRRQSWLFTSVHGGKMSHNRLKLKQKGFSLATRKLLIHEDRQAAE